MCLISLVEGKACIRTDGAKGSEQNTELGGEAVQASQMMSIPVGTLVLLQSGDLVTADKLTPGEYLLALDVDSGVLKAARVIAVWHGETVTIEHNQVGAAVFAEGADTEAQAGRLVAVSLLAALPREQGRFLSLGSQRHGRCNCVPCKFIGTARGCRDGVLCGLCHFSHLELTRSAKRSLIRRSSVMPQVFTLESLLVAEESPCDFDSERSTAASECLVASNDDETKLELIVKHTFLHLQKPKLGMRHSASEPCFFAKKQKFVKHSVYQ